MTNTVKQISAADRVKNTGWTVTMVADFPAEAWKDMNALLAEIARLKAEHALAMARGESQ